MKPNILRFNCDKLTLFAGCIHLPSLVNKYAKESEILRIVTYALPSEIGYIAG
jgi:hypothetical protein